MTQGMFTAVSAIRANQTRLNVIGNNIANLNTVAFKGSNVNFRSLFYQTYSAGTSPNNTVGGTNPLQVGNGVAIADIAANFSQGGSLFTGRNTDLMIEGEGFFTIEQSDTVSGSGQSGSFYLTRAGNFTVDGSGNLVTSVGNKVLGTRTVDGNDESTVSSIKVQDKVKIWKERAGVNNDVIHTWIDQTGSTSVPTATSGGTVTGQEVSITNFSIGSDGGMELVYSNADRITVRNTPATPNIRQIFHKSSEGPAFGETLGAGDKGTVTILNTILKPEQLQLRMGAVTNPAGLVSQGSGNYLVGPNAGTVRLGAGKQSGRGQITMGALESANVDVSNEFTGLILAQRGLEAAGKIITTQSEVLKSLINLV
jgi:flagellar hook protein FlgE